MKFTTNTSVLPLLDVGLYGSLILDMLPDDMTSEEWIEFEKLICETAEEVINEMLEPIEVRVKVLKFDSPKYYNFENDWIDFEVIMDENRMLALYLLKEELEDEFFEWAREKWGHRSGFFSFMPFDRERWEESGEEWRKLSMIIQFIFRFEKILEEYQQAYEWKIMESNLFNELVCRGEEDYE